MQAMSVTLVANGDKFLQITKSAVEICLVLKALPACSLVFQEINTSTLQRIIKYCEHYKSTPLVNLYRVGPSIEGWNKDFTGTLNQKALFEVILRTSVLEIGNLEDLRCQTVANMVKGKTVEKIKKGGWPNGYQSDEWSEDK
ncbi:hypothetical protein BGZ47_007961 [Haplosporangium gracile]|nr:hypothetical protein BGZ47_007961 [Haplosporangium gracile]